MACPHCGKPIANPRADAVAPPLPSIEVPLVITKTTPSRSINSSLQSDFSSNRLPLLFVGGIIVGAIAVFLFLVLPLITSTPRPVTKATAATLPTAAAATHQPDGSTENDLRALTKSQSIASMAAPKTGGANEANDAPLSVADVIELMEPSVVRIDVLKGESIGTGSGFFITADGIVVTNNHVIEGARSALVTLSDGAVLTTDGQRVLSRAKDLALLRTELNGRSVKPVKLAETAPRKGEQVVAIGAPHGLSFSASEGIVSAIRSSREASQLGLPIAAALIQTTTPISAGNSGGPLVNLRGEVVGINTLGSVSSEAQNLNFAVSNEEILAILNATPENRPDN